MELGAVAVVPSEDTKDPDVDWGVLNSGRAEDPGAVDLPETVDDVAKGECYINNNFLNNMTHSNNQINKPGVDSIPAVEVILEGSVNDEETLVCGSMRPVYMIVVPGTEKSYYKTIYQNTASLDLLLNLRCTWFITCSNL